MDRYEYMKLPLGIIPDEIVQQYKQQNLAHKGILYMEIKKNYGLPQAVKNTNDKLRQHIYEFGYDLSPITPLLWRHQTRPLQFSLVVDDVGVQYERQADINHLIYALKTN